MDSLSFVVQVIEKTLPIIAGVAVGTGMIFVAHEMGLEPIASLPRETYASFVATGIIAGSITVVTRPFIVFLVIKDHGAVEFIRRSKRFRT